MMSGQLQKEIEDLNKKLTSTSPAGVVEKSDVQQAKTPPAQSVEKPAAEKIHIVQKGENLYRIALRYGLTEARLLELNNLKPKAIIYPGQKLKVSR